MIGDGVCSWNNPLAASSHHHLLDIVSIHIGPVDDILVVEIGNCYWVDFDIDVGVGSADNLVDCIVVDHRCRIPLHPHHNRHSHIGSRRWWIDCIVGPGNGAVVNNGVVVEGVVDNDFGLVEVVGSVVDEYDH